MVITTCRPRDLILLMDMSHLWPQTSEMIKLLWSPVSRSQEDLKVGKESTFRLSSDMLTCAPVLRKVTSLLVQMHPALSCLHKAKEADRQPLVGEEETRAVWDSTETPGY